MKNLFAMLTPPQKEAGDGPPAKGWAWVDIEEGRLRGRIRQFANSLPPELVSDFPKHDPHVTLIYGLAGTDPAPVAELLAGRLYAKGTLQPLDVFHNQDYDVLHIPVSSSCLGRMHWAIRNQLGVECSHSDYNPHITVAYLQPGTGKAFKGVKVFDGREVTFSHVKIKMAKEDPCSCEDAPIAVVPLDNPCEDEEHAAMVAEYRARVMKALSR